MKQNEDRYGMLYVGLGVFFVFFLGACMNIMAKVYRLEREQVPEIGNQIENLANKQWKQEKNKTDIGRTGKIEIDIDNLSERISRLEGKRWYRTKR